MKRSFLSVLVAAYLVGAVACAGDEAGDDTEPVEDQLTPAPPPPPPPPPPPTTTDTAADTTTTTTGQ